MSAEELRRMMAEELRTIAEDVENLPGSVTKQKINGMIQNLYEVMRQLSDYAEK